MRKCTNTIFSLIIISLFPCITLNKSTKTKPTLRRKTTIDELLYTSNNLDIHTALLKKTSGSNWKMWDRNSTYTTTLSSISKEQRCDWAKFRVNGYVADMCTHGDDEVLSKVIKSHGRWGECDLLTVLWHDYTRKSVFVDAGANIGSCVLHMCKYIIKFSCFCILYFTQHFKTNFLHVFYLFFCVLVFTTSASILGKIKSCSQKKMQTYAYAQIFEFKHLNHIQEIYFV